MINTSAIRERFAAVERDLNERARRLLAAVEAKTAGYGGIAATSRATGIARSTIGRGLKDLAMPESLSGEVRRPGGGGPPLIEKNPTLLEDLRLLVEPATMGDPMRPLMWVSKSHAKLAAALREMGHKIADSSIPKLLGLLKYRRQVNRKTLEGSHNPAPRCLEWVVTNQFHCRGRAGPAPPASSVTQGRATVKDASRRKGGGLRPSLTVARPCVL